MRAWGITPTQLDPRDGSEDRGRGTRERGEHREDRERPEESRSSGGGPRPRARAWVGCGTYPRPVCCWVGPDRVAPAPGGEVAAARPAGAAQVTELDRPPGATQETQCETTDEDPIEEFTQAGAVGATRAETVPGQSPQLRPPRSRAARRSLARGEWAIRAAAADPIFRGVARLGRCATVMAAKPQAGASTVARMDCAEALKRFRKR